MNKQIIKTKKQKQIAESEMADRARITVQKASLPHFSHRDSEYKI
jgi:hypothetical protein